MIREVELEPLKVLERLYFLDFRAALDRGDFEASVEVWRSWISKQLDLAIFEAIVRKYKGLLQEALMSE